ncbi:MAG: hypothetical protein HFH49_04665 [Lachnospiraceae bacterium]|nr:hypothetical protein [Lachnospiraceae bacterium]
MAESERVFPGVWEVRIFKFLLIVGKKGNAVLLSEDEWNAIQETLYLNSIKGMAESIRNGVKTPVEDCISEDMVEW